MAVMRPVYALSAALIALAAPAAALAQGAPPRERTLSSGWEMRVDAAAPAPPQEAPPEETAPGSEAPPAPATAAGRAAQAPGPWTATRVPSVFDAHALPSLYPGEVRRYRVSFKGPPTPRGFSWLLRFESVRRTTAVILNGRRIGRNVDPYTPFTLEARGLRPGRTNELVVIVDGRKNPDVPEAWWNWIGIVRPVELVPAGPAHIQDLGTMSRVQCRGPARGCRAELLLDGMLQRRGPRSIAPSLDVKLRSPSGRVTTRSFRLPRQRYKERRLQLSMPVPAPQLWSPDAPQLYAAEFNLREGGRVVQQVVRPRDVRAEVLEIRHVAVQVGSR